MTTPRREVSLARSLAKTDFGALAWPEGTVAAIVGIGGAIGILSSTDRAARIAVVGDSLSILGVLLGVVFAAFALLIALMSDEYVRLLDKASDGVVAFMRPFMVAIGVQVTTIFLAIGYRATALDLDSKVEVLAFVVWAFLFTFAVSDVIALTRTIMLHGLTRARLAKLAAPDDDSSSPD